MMLVRVITVPVKNWCQVRTLARARRPPAASRPEHRSPPPCPRGSVPMLPILKYPHPQLRAPNEEIEIFDESLYMKAQALFKCMYQLKGVGLAAPQVGINERLIVVNAAGSKGKGLPAHELAMVNPKILNSSKAAEVDQESCLSLPLVYGDVPRSLSIIVSYTTLQGEKKKEEFTDYEARIIQHEVDHLNGVLFIDRMAPEELSTYESRLQRYIKTHGEGGTP